MKRQRHAHGRLTLNATQQNLLIVAQSVFNDAERAAFDQGKQDFQSSNTRSPAVWVFQFAGRLASRMGSKRHRKPIKSWPILE